MAQEVIVTQPAVEPVSLSDMKAHLRLGAGHAVDNEYITDLIAAARAYFEERTGRCVINQTWRTVLDKFPFRRANDDWWDGVREGAFNELTQGGAIKLNRPPFVSVSSVKYWDRTETLVTLDPTKYRLNANDGTIKPKTGYPWPVDLRDEDAVEVEYVSGYGAAALNVPRSIRQALMIIAAHWYENREIILQGNAAVTMLVGEVPETFNSIVAAYKVHRL
jgi:uncharacterized phiE125 gp8 family phage protein